MVPQRPLGFSYLTCPSADQANEVHWGGSALLLVVITSCLSSSTMILPSRSCEKIRMETDIKNRKPWLPSISNYTESNGLRNSLWFSTWEVKSDGIVCFITAKMQLLVLKLLNRQHSYIDRSEAYNANSRDGFPHHQPKLSIYSGMPMSSDNPSFPFFSSCSHYVSNL